MNGQMQCGCGSTLSFSAAADGTRCERGAPYAVTVTQLLGGRGGLECVNCGGDGAGSRALVATDEWEREMALCGVCADELGEEAGIDVAE